MSIDGLELSVVILERSLLLFFLETFKLFTKFLWGVGTNSLGIFKAQLTA
jgi:hypothetical protein